MINIDEVTFFRSKISEVNQDIPKTIVPMMVWALTDIEYDALDALIEPHD